MNDSQNRKSVPPGTDEEIERTIHMAARHLGWFLPTTEDEVAEVEGSAGEYPPAPAGPLESDLLFDQFLSGAPLSASPSLQRVVDTEVEFSLRRAAREGREIPPEVEERMSLDREAAERGREGAHE